MAFDNGKYAEMGHFVCVLIKIKLKLWCYTEFMSASGKLKNMPDHGENRIYAVQNTVTQCCIRVCDISDHNRGIIPWDSRRNLCE